MNSLTDKNKQVYTNMDGNNLGLKSIPDYNPFFTSDIYGDDFTVGAVMYFHNNPSQLYLVSYSNEKEYTIQSIKSPFNKGQSIRFRDNYGKNSVIGYIHGLNNINQYPQARNETHTKLMEYFPHYFV